MVTTLGDRLASLRKGKGKRTRVAYRVALWMLVAGFVLQLLAQLMS